MGEFTDAGAEIIADLAEAMLDDVVSIMREADFLVPKDTETLRESADILPFDYDGHSIGITFGYGFGGAINPKTGKAVETYTVPVHEILDAFHEPPTQAKFLEEPLFAYAGVMEGRLAAELRTTYAKRLSGTRPSRTGVRAFGGGYSYRDIAGRFAKAT